MSANELKKCIRNFNNVLSIHVLANMWKTFEEIRSINENSHTYHAIPPSKVGRIGDVVTLEKKKPQGLCQSRNCEGNDLLPRGGYVFTYCQKDMFSILKIQIICSFCIATFEYWLWQNVYSLK